MIATPAPGINLGVVMKGRKVRTGIISAASVKAFHDRQAYLRHQFNDEYVTMAWKVGLGLSGESTAATPLYTLFDWRVLDGEDGTWAWKYRVGTRMVRSLTGCPRRKSTTVSPVGSWMSTHCGSPYSLSEDHAPRRVRLGKTRSRRFV